MSATKSSLPGTQWFLAGLISRSIMLLNMGVFDMDFYFEWGKKALESGLANAFLGVYFPFQYQIFELGVWATRRSGLTLVITFKLVNLLFDIAVFWVLVLLLKRQQLNPSYALLYWFHPWFLAVFSLGYIDFQFTLFVLLTIYCLRGDAVSDYVLAGIPLGLAFVMKPQSEILIVGVLLYVIFHYVRKSSLRPVGMMLGPILLFLSYEIYFTVKLFPTLRYAAANVLPMSYLNVTNVMPSLSAQMPNIWYPIAYLLKKPGDPIVSVSDQLLVLPYLSAKWIAVTITLTLIAFVIFRVERDISSTICNKFIMIFGISSLIVPFVMTSAHENHLFLGSVFLVLFLANGCPFLFKLACHILLAIQFLNICGLYGQFPVSIGQFWQNMYSEQLAVGYSLVSVVCVVIVLKSLMFPTRMHHRA